MFILSITMANNRRAGFSFQIKCKCLKFLKNKGV
jgi:hypothetical protein